MDLGGIENLGIDRVLRRGTGEIIAEQKDALFVYDRISGIYMLACENEASGISMLDRYISQDVNLLMVTNFAVGKIAFERYSFTEKLECYQAMYTGEKPVIDTRIRIRTADEHDLPMLIENYKLLTPKELEMVVKRKSLLLGYDQGNLVGFMGEHLEGSMGILYIFPEYRHRGFAIALETYVIAQMMEKGVIPFAQVVKDNQASLNLQKKIGMTISDNLIMWMWKDAE